MISEEIEPPRKRKMIDVFLEKLYLQQPLLIYGQQILEIGQPIEIVNDRIYLLQTDYLIVRTGWEEITVNKEKLIHIPKRKDVLRNDSKWS